MRREECGWSDIEAGVLCPILEYLGRNQPWKEFAQTFHLINKHWRDAIRECLTVIRPRCKFEAPMDLKALLQFPNVHSIVLEGCEISEWRDCWDLPCTGLTALQSLKISNPEAMEPLLSVFCQATGLTQLCLKDSFLSDSALYENLHKLTSLKHLKLQSMEVVPTRSLCPILIKLERLELSMMVDARIGPTHDLRMPGFQIYRGSEWNFSSLTSLTALILDGRIEGSSLDLSGCVQLAHLSLSITEIPVWLGDLTQLRSLSLNTWSRFCNRDQRDALLSIASQLTSLACEWHNAMEASTDHLLVSAKDLHKVSIRHPLLSRDIRRFQKLKKLKLITLKPLKKCMAIEIMESISRLPSLELLTLNLRCTITRDMFDAFRSPSAISQSLTELVIHRLVRKNARVIITDFFNLRKLHLIECDFTMTPFTNTRSTELQLLTSLCFSDCLWGDVGSMLYHLPFSFSNHLKHLALPPRSFKHHSAAIRRFQQRVPHVHIDDRPLCDPDAFSAARLN